MSDNLNAAGVDVNDLTGESARLTEQMKALAEQQEKAAEEAQNLGENGVSAFDAMGSALMAAGIAEGLHKIADAYKECVGVSMEFDATMSTVEALSGASASSMEELSAKAKELGATTVFTANQSASAMTFMGMAGWGAGEMLGGMNGVMNLAAASGEDLATVSDIVTDNLTAFGLTANDTARFADVLAQAATNSNTNVSIMGETFKGSASVAGALGYSIEDVAAAVGLMANAGVKGSVAGTALKNTFNGLLNGATLTAAAFGEVEFSAINADGTIDSFSDTINELRGYFSQMTEAERVQNAQVLAGQRGYNGLLAILNATDDDYQSLTNSINNSAGAAQRMADIKLNNLQGDVTLLDSATEGLKMTLGGLWTNEFRGIVQVGTSIISGINSFIEKNPAVAKGLMTFVGIAGSLLGVYKGISTVKKVMNTLSSVSAALTAKETAAAVSETAAETASAAATTANAAAHVSLNAAMATVAVSFAAAMAAVTVLHEAYKVQSLDTMELTTATAEQYGEVERLNAEYEEAVEKYGEASDKARALKYDLDEATAAIDAQSFSVSGLYSEIDALHDSTGALLSSSGEVAAKYDEQKKSADILAAKLREVASSSETAAEKEALMKPIVEKLNELYPQLNLTVKDAANNIDGVGKAIDKAASSAGLKEKADAAKQSLAELYVKQEQLRDAAEKADIAQSKAAVRYREATDNYGKVLFSFWNGNAKDLNKDWEEASDKAQTAHADLAAVNEEIERQKAAYYDYYGTLEGISDEMVSAQKAVEVSIGSVSDSVETLMSAYTEAYNTAYDSINGQYKLWTDAEETIPTSVDTINKALESQITHWNEYSDNLALLREKAGEIDGLTDVINSFADGSKESVNVIAGMAEASNEELQTMVKNYQEQQKAQDEAAKNLADFRVDVDGELKNILSGIETAVEGMDMSDAAKNAAKKTVQAYINEIKANIDGVSDAGAAMREALENALNRAGKADEREYAAGGVDPDEVNAQRKAEREAENAAREAREAEEWENARRNDVAETEALGYHNIYTDTSIYTEEERKKIFGYASGTDNAAQGWAVVGEEGPELMYMRGGEQVIPAKPTRALLYNSGGAQITVSPQFIIQGSVDDTTESKLQEMSERLVEMVKDALDEAENDRRRSVYA